MNSKEILYKIKLLKFQMNQNDSYCSANVVKLLEEMKELQQKLDIILNFINSNLSG